MLQRLALLSMLTLAAACGTDQTAGGPTVGGAGGDTTTDTTASDSGAVTDGGAVTDSDGGGGLCGDGTCDPGESQASCPLDCKGTPTGGPVACLKSKCSAQTTQCEADKACVSFLACASKCDGLACVQSCLQQGGEPGKPVKRVLQCGSSSQCFDTPKPTCGDGGCSAGESATSCPQDCAKPVVCGNGKCELGETLDSCPKDCGSQGPVCGNGKCEGPQENAKTCPKDCQQASDSCVGKCGKFNGNNACACDKQCSQFGDCCKDYKAVCGGGSSAVCGNGKCEDGESAKSCPKDCSDVDPISCAKAKCPKEYAQCQDNATCGKLLSCFTQCKPGDDDCYEKCGDAFGDNPPKSFLVLAQCAEKNGCGGGSPGPVCGDGQCEDGEQKTCPSDCQPPGPVCGNGKCEQGENAFMCPKDCQQTKPVCGDGKCQGPQENQLTCPKDCGGIQDLMTCAKNKCSDSYKKCEGDAACKKALDCMAGCKDTGCLQSCAFKNQGAWNTFGPLAQCAQQKGCLSGGSTGPTCGDGKCEQGESPSSCPKDCSGPVCGNGQCEPGEGPKSCPKDCGPSTTCGDGKCQFPQEDTKTCPADCKAADLTCKGSGCSGQGTGGCWCDNVCEKAGDCCPDKVAVCGSNNTPTCGNGQCEQGETAQSCPKDCQKPQPVCGDGVCAATAGETEKTCPKDCATSTKPCAKKSDCADAEVCCGKPNGNVCVPAGQCF